MDRRHRKRLALLVDLVVASLLAAVLYAPIGVGHGAATYFANTWAAGDLSQHYNFEDEFPGGELRQRVQDGAKDWHPRPSAMEFYRDDFSVQWFYGTPCDSLDPGENGIFWNQIDGHVGQGRSTWAQTRRCPSPTTGAVDAFEMELDRQEDWHSGTGGAPSNRLDTWGVATHEFGHASGWGSHFDDDWGICTDPPRHSMCRSMDYGEEFRRDPAEHDKHTFDAAY